MTVLSPKGSICVDSGHGLHPFFGHRFDAGPVRLVSIVQAFNYRVAVLRDGAKPALRTGHSRRAERGFLEDVSIPWDQQVAVMFQIVSALVLDVPEAAACQDKFRGVPPNILLAFEPWGHIDHAGSECQCLSCDRTGVYIHALSIDQSHRDCTSSPLLSPPDIVPGENIPGDSSVLVSTKILSV